MRYRAIIFKGIFNPIPTVFTFYWNKELVDLKDEITKQANENMTISFIDIKNRLRIFPVNELKRIIIK